MSDLIDRQAAICAIEKRMDDITCEEFAEGMSEAITEISLLPSAQPERKTGRWIPCSERQPDVNGWYVTTISGEICGQDRAFSGMSEFANGKWMSGDDVDETEMTIAWMPLPEPYCGGE